MKKRKWECHFKKPLSLPVIMMILIMGMVAAAVLTSMFIFMVVYQNSMKQDAVTASSQAVVQASNAVESYLDDMYEVMDQISQYYQEDKEDKAYLMESLVELRTDVAALTVYSESGVMEEAYTGTQTLKENIFKNLSWDVGVSYSKEEVNVSRPHVETLLQNYFPWVVSISKDMLQEDGTTVRVIMDIKFSQIADYVDDVGIGQHGYCFIMDAQGTIIYHPQQQLIFSGLKSENTEKLSGLEGAMLDDNVIYTVNGLDNSEWKVVGVSYVDELIASRTQRVVFYNLFLLLAVVLATFLISYWLSHYISKPIRSLIHAMKDFERNAENFSFQAIQGSKEMIDLSNSFDHMVYRIQKLMNQVRQEEITLKKTELKALQAQINPHFLYNTLDAIGWLCEEERNEDAVKMVNALAKLFRISISRGKEMIPIRDELEHASRYLQIEKFRYKNQFTYTFQVDESCLEYYCNKITLQPIIENAIYHGLNRMVDEGEIHIVLKSEENDIIFLITDNGVGMRPEEAEGILNREPGDLTGIGIKNVNDRIKIYFGEKYGLTIQSELDEGTQVTIRMPKVRKEDIHEGK